LCVAPHCRIRRRHLDACQACPCGEPTRCRQAEHCDGCQPRTARDGLYLCDLCTRRIAEDARTAAVLHEDLALTLIVRRGKGERRGNGDSAPIPDAEVIEARSAIKATLVSIVKVIAEERGFSYPDDEAPAIAEYIARSAEWLAGHRAAAEHAHDLRDLASDSRNWRLAYPSGTDRLYIGDCPRPRDDDAACGTRLYQRADQAEVTCRGCGYTDTIEWWQRAIVGEASGRVDAYAIAAYLSMHWCRPVDASLIWQWAARGHIERYGQDERRRTLYDLDQCRQYAARIWGRAA